MTVADTPLILLAGGRSQRMGLPKGLLPFAGHTWLEEQIRRFGASGGKRVCLVLGHGAPSYLEKFCGLAEGATEWNGVLVETVVNQDPDRGPFSSLQEGLARLQRIPTKTPAFVSPIDTPVPEGTLLARLADAMQGRVMVVKPVWQGKGGHPVLISAGFAKALAKIDPLGPEARLDAQIRGLPPASVQSVESEDPFVVLNLNTPGEWATFTR